MEGVFLGIYVIGQCVKFTWILAYLAMSLFGTERARVVRGYLTWPVIVFIVLVVGPYDIVTGDTWACINDACYLVLAWRIRHDDDEWKRLRHKATETVREVAGRLVVVPQPVGAN